MQLIKTPYLWLGSVYDTKKVMSFLAQVAGKGILDVEMRAEEGTKIKKVFSDIPIDNKNAPKPNPIPLNDNVFNRSLAAEYTRELKTMFRNCEFIFTIKDSVGLIRFILFAIIVENKRPSIEVYPPPANAQAPRPRG